jgi:hypothetical protein
MLQRDAVQKLKLNAARCDSGKSADPILHRESRLLKNHKDATGDFKNQRGIAIP